MEKNTDSTGTVSTLFERCGMSYCGMHSFSNFVKRVDGLNKLNKYKRLILKIYKGQARVLSFNLWKSRKKKRKNAVTLECIVNCGSWQKNKKSPIVISIYLNYDWTHSIYILNVYILFKETDREHSLYGFVFVNGQIRGEI